MMEFRLYDKERKEFIEGSEQFCLSQSGEIGFFDYSNEFRSVEDEYGLSFRTPKTDRNGDSIYQGDILKRTRDKVAEFDRKHYEEKGYDEIESLIDDKSGSFGVVVFDGMRFTVKLLEGHKWAFHGPEGGFAFDWDEEVEVVGNKWQDDLNKYERGQDVC